MYRPRRLRLAVAIAVLCLVLASCAPAPAVRQRSEYVADHGATVAAQRYASESQLLQGIMPADEIRVEGYLNYYPQRFAQPPEGSAVGMDAALGSTHIPDAGGEVWLQVGLQSGAGPEQEIAPLNMALVLDKSGSMAERDKMSFLKQALHIFVDELDPEDLIAIVVYDDEAEVLLPTQTVGDGVAVHAAIDQLRPGGWTNLHGGLMLGYEQVEAFYDPDLNNRVMLLTDGIANRGVTEPAEVAADSMAYNEKGIFLSTIGLGLEFNDELLHTLAEQGKGNYYFINDAEEMDKVFRQEIAGLVQTVATDVWLTLDLAEGTQVQRVYGYDYELDEDTMRVQFDNAEAEGSQVLMVKMVVPGGEGGEGGERSLAHATLEYNDVFAEESAVQEADLTVSYGAPTPYDPLVSPQVRRNVVILQMAQALQEVSYLVDEARYEDALSLVGEVKGDVWRVATEEDDADMKEDVEILDNYETTLQRLIEMRAATPVPTRRRPGY